MVRIGDTHVCFGVALILSTACVPMVGVKHFQGLLLATFDNLQTVFDAVR